MNNQTIIHKLLRRYGYTIDKLFPRPSVLEMKKFELNRPLKVAEIGVLNGEHAESILKTLNIDKLYLVDVWESYNGYQQDFINLEEEYEVAKKRLEKYGDKVIFIKGKSAEVLDKIPNDLDFVYIDANHTYKYCSEDMENYYKKLKQGGVLAGHDIENFNIPNHYGVTKAFCKFVVKHNLKPFICRPDWWCYKEKK